MHTGLIIIYGFCLPSLRSHLFLRMRDTASSVLRTWCSWMLLFRSVYRLAAVATAAIFMALLVPCFHQKLLKDCLLLPNFLPWVNTIPLPVKSYSKPKFNSTNIQPRESMFIGLTYRTRARDCLQKGGRLRGSNTRKSSRSMDDGFQSSSR